MRIAFGFVTGFVVLADPAMAHIGHFGELAGHDHWIAAGALGAAAALAALRALKGRKAAQEAEKADAEEAEPEPQEA